MNLDDLAIKYAINRKNYKETKEEIKVLNPVDEIGAYPYTASYQEIELDAHRLHWYSNEEHEKWEGWVLAVEYYQKELSGKVDRSTPEHELAAKLDRLKELKVECGKLRRQLYCEGMKLVNKKKG
jgi:hypothetical protein